MIMFTAQNLIIRYIPYLRALIPSAAFDLFSQANCEKNLELISCLFFDLWIAVRADSQANRSRLVCEGGSSIWEIEEMKICFKKMLPPLT